MDWMDGRMIKLSASKARNELSVLLDQVERGEEVVITRRGRAVAKLVHIESTVDRRRARKAALQIRECAKAMKLGAFDWQEWKQYRDDGRR
jgi:prevent-host-death family protein